MRNQWYTTRWAVLGFHALAWGFVFSIPLLFPDKRHPDEQRSIFEWSHVMMTVTPMVLFYLNANWLIPNYLNTRRTRTYLVWLLVCFFIYLLLNTFFWRPIKDHYTFELNRYSLLSIIPFLFFWALSSVYRLTADRVNTERLLKERENEGLKTELLFLRSQISPHFLFNVLNNMVAMARLRSEQLEPSLIKLSGLMRYMLYESDEEKVPLGKEVGYVNSYIDLQRLRFGRDLQIHLDIRNFRHDAHLIEPMLLVPFIENAFKHGTGLMTQPEISIQLTVTGPLLAFNVRNRYDPDSVEIKDKTSGIGMANVRRRLNLLYEKSHSLVITKQDGWFSVNLQLTLQ